MTPEQERIVRKYQAGFNTIRNPEAYNRSPGNSLAAIQYIGEAQSALREIYPETEARLQAGVKLADLTIPERICHFYMQQISQLDMAALAAREGELVVLVSLEREAAIHDCAPITLVGDAVYPEYK